MIKLIRYNEVDRSQCQRHAWVCEFRGIMKSRSCNAIECRTGNVECSVYDGSCNQSDFAQSVMRYNVM